MKDPQKDKERQLTTSVTMNALLRRLDPDDVTEPVEQAPEPDQQGQDMNETIRRLAGRQRGVIE